MFKKKAVKVLVSLPPDGGFGWLVVVASFWLCFVVDGCMMIFGIFIGAMGDDLHVTTTEVLLIYSTQLGVYFLCGPYVSVLIQLFGFRVVTFIGLTIGALGYLLASFTNHYTLTLLMYGVLGGIGAGMAFAPSIIIVSLWFEKYRAIATGIAFCGSSLGGMLVTPLFQYLLDTYGRSRTHQMQAVLVALAYLSALAFRVPDESELTLEEDAFNAAHKAYQSRLSLDMGTMSPRQFQSVFHPVIALPARKQPWWRCGCCRHSDTGGGGGGGGGATTAKTVRLGALDRQDIYFGGSVADLEALTSHSLDRIKRSGSLVTAAVADDGAKRCGCCPAVVCNTIDRLIDLKLFGSVTFLVLLLALFLWMLGLYTPYLMIIERAREAGIEERKSNALLPIISIGCTVGRIVAGLSSFVPQLEPTYLVALVTVAGGVASSVSAYVEVGNYSVQVMYAVLFGICSSFVLVLRSVLYVKYMGIESLTSVYGIASMCMGFAALAGSPLSQLIRMRSGDFAYSFVYCGGCHIASGLLFILLRYACKWERSRYA